MERESERGEHGDLGQAGERALKALDLPLERGTDVAEEETRDEDRQEARPVRERGDSVDDRRRDGHPQRIETLARQRDPAHQLEQESGSGDADGKSDRHFDREVLGDRPHG